MPGYANYKRLYIEEYKTLFEEGYDVEKYIVDDENSEDFCPNPQNVDNYPTGDDFWQKPYENLVKVMDTPLRADFPYIEPNTFDEIKAQTIVAPVLEPISDEEYEKRIQGGFYGRCASVILGKPLEMGLSKDFIKKYLESVNAYPLNDFVPEKSEKLDFTLRQDCIYSTKGHVKFAQSDDDINYTLLGLRFIEIYGFEIEPWKVVTNWADNIAYQWCWCASRVAYYHYVRNEIPYEKRPYVINPWRECIDGQIRTDIWGYVFPSQLDKAMLHSFKDTSATLTKNGIYGGMFVAGAIAGALSKNPTVDKIIDSGLASIPKKSRLFEAISLVREWFKETHDWNSVADKILEKYGHIPCEGTLNNLAMVALGIIAGELDYTKSITIATMCGLDTDCNAGTVGSIVGCAVGIDNIEKRWIDPLNDTIKSTVACFGDCKISEICRRIISAKKKADRLFAKK